MQYIDDADFQIRIDDDQGANIASVVWREMEFALPFRGSPLNYGWYGLSPWAGRIRDGLITSPTTGVHQLPTNLMPPHAIHGFGFVSSWQEIGPGRSLLHLPKPYGSATVEQRVEVPGVKVDVVDTVGAGDTVGAIVVEAMLAHGLVELRGDLLRSVLTRAAAAAAITCSRKGAQPPFKHELPTIEAGK